ncbi:RNA-guided endonuclease TnpB family protein [Halolactibacillus sp. JCM 19043]|uniref:RNA-guided endonuclease InsQ/TnpB family protein n=1 Tax=Halolactibacillus sp. JCM 19043 TaxID=1460638 RepID=UPI000782012A|nr:RNA-guided endonuclease TnpB family protein [Halolactibacillus sp. JCM 19043]
MIKAYKIKLNPNNKQRTQLEHSAGVARWAYNWALEQKKKHYEETGKTISQGDLRKHLTKLKQTDDYQWLFQFSNNITKQAIKDSDEAFKRFFKGQAKYPRFKSKRKSKWSFYNDNHKVKLSDTHIRLEKIGWVRFAETGFLSNEFRPLAYRISRYGLHWYVSITVERPDSSDYSTPVNEPIGIDLGIKTLATVSHGKIYTNINKKNQVRKIEKRLRRLQRQVSRKYEMNKEERRYRKTCNIIKIENEMTRLRTRLNHIRTDYIHKMTSEIVRTKPSHIVIEDLNVRGMMKNKHLSDHVSKCHFYEIRKQLTYKTEQLGISLVVADRWYPSSKTCCECGVIDKTLKLSDRKMKCKCGSRIDRDLNASINLSRLAV